MGSLALGFGLGVAVGSQLGPMSLLLIRSTLRGTLRVGLAIGAGIAVIDTLYAAVGAAGVAPVLTLGTVRTILGLIGAGVLMLLGARTLISAMRVRLGGELAEEVLVPRRAFLTALAATASNPLTVASWAAIFASATTAGAAGSAPASVALVAGIGLGSLTAVSGLALATSVARRWVGQRAMRVLDGAAGAGLLGFGGLLGARSLEQR